MVVKYYISPLYGCKFTIDKQNLSHSQITRICNEAIIFWVLPGFIVSSSFTRQGKANDRNRTDIELLCKQPHIQSATSALRSTTPRLVFDS